MTLSRPARWLLPALLLPAMMALTLAGVEAKAPSPPERMIRQNLQDQIARIRRNKPMLNALGLNFLGASFSNRSRVATFTFMLRRGISHNDARLRLARAARVQKASICRGAKPLFQHGIAMHVTVLDSTGRNFSAYAFNRQTCG